MTFTRTKEGLSTQHLFVKADWVVYVEGGPGVTPEEASTGKACAESIDILFWRRLFEHHIPNLIFDVRALGSKSNLIKIARWVAAGEESRVCVAMDRDLDDRFGGIIRGRGVLYTKGYSWENDTCQPAVVIGIVEALCPVSMVGQDIQREVDTAFEHFIKSARWIVHADILTRPHQVRVIPKDNPRTLISSTPGGEPRVDRAKGIRLIAQACNRMGRRNVTRAGGRPTVAVLSDCCGHMIGEFSYRLVVYLVRRHSNAAVLPKQTFQALAIDRYALLLATDASLAAHKHHYLRQFSRVPV